MTISELMIVLSKRKR